MDPSLTNAAWHGRPRYSSPHRSRSGLKLLAAVAFAIVLVSAGSLLYRTRVDPHMGAQAAGRALSARVHNGGIYKCHRAEKDQTLWFMDDVDYACNAVNKPILSGYWIGTDSDSITEVEPNG